MSRESDFFKANPLSAEVPAAEPVEIGDTHEVLAVAPEERGMNRERKNAVCDVGSEALLSIIAAEPDEKVREQLLGLRMNDPLLNAWWRMRFSGHVQAPQDIHKALAKITEKNRLPKFKKDPNFSARELRALLAIVIDQHEKDAGVREGLYHSLTEDHHKDLHNWWQKRFNKSFHDIRSRLEIIHSTWNSEEVFIDDELKFLREKLQEITKHFKDPGDFLRARNEKVTEENRGAYELQDLMMDVVRKGTPAELGLIRKTYESLYHPRELQGIITFFDFLEMGGKSSHMYEERLEGYRQHVSKKEKFHKGQMTDSFYLQCDFIDKNEKNAAFLKTYWEVLEAASLGQNFRMLRSGIMAPVASKKLFRALGYNASFALPREDAHNAIDMWIDQDTTLQIKGTKHAIALTEVPVVQFPAVMVEGGKESFVVSDLHTDERQRYAMKVSDYGKSINKTLRALWLDMPWDCYDRVTGVPHPETVERVKKEFESIRSGVKAAPKQRVVPPQKETRAPKKKEIRRYGDIPLASRPSFKNFVLIHTKIFGIHATSLKHVMQKNGDIPKLMFGHIMTAAPSLIKKNFGIEFSSPQDMLEWIASYYSDEEITARTHAGYEALTHPQEFQEERINVTRRHVVNYYQKHKEMFGMVDHSWFDGYIRDPHKTHEDDCVAQTKVIHHLAVRRFRRMPKNFEAIVARMLVEEYDASV